MNKCDELAGVFGETLLRSIPRILSQLDRDPDSPTFGCFDRNFWHYRMRDFSSIVLQQGLLVLDALHDFDHPENPLYHNPLATEWINAALKFWASQQLASGSFNEYYPFEEGFPPTAFSLYAVGLVFRKRGFPAPDQQIQVASQKACDWLLNHSEQQAMNQESAGLAGLALASHIPGVRVDAARLEARLVAFFASQSPEGWFPEYGGADIGYLSVTLDCLWDYYETTGDQRAMVAMERATGYLSHFVSVSGNTPIMINSRNTDYIVPYGLIRLAAVSPLAAGIVRVLFKNVDTPSHFLSSTDDRYTCHYVYQSCFRGLGHITEMISEKALLPCDVGGRFCFVESGVYVRHWPGCHSIFAAGKKGGIFYHYTSEGLAVADYGWRWERSGGKVAVTHWQCSSIVTFPAGNEAGEVISVDGRFTVHGWYRSSPLLHLLLRLAAFFSGNRLISLLKDAMIFKAPAAGVGYQRTIKLNDDEVIITDVFTGKDSVQFNPEPAPHYSLRHVASAGNFSREELVVKAVPQRVVGVRTAEITYEARIALKS